MTLPRHNKLVSSPWCLCNLSARAFFTGTNTVLYFLHFTLPDCIIYHFRSCPVFFCFLLRTFINFLYFIFIQTSLSVQVFHSPPSLLPFSSHPPPFKSFIFLPLLFQRRAWAFQTLILHWLYSCFAPCPSATRQLPWRSDIFDRTSRFTFLLEKWCRVWWRFLV